VLLIAATIVKVRLSDFTRTGALTLNSGEDDLESAAIDSAGGFAYFGTGTSPGIVVKISLSNFTRAEALTLGLGENKLAAAVDDPERGLAYFGTLTSPGKVVKVRTDRPSTVFDYSLSNSGNINVRKGETGSNRIFATLTNGDAQNVTLTCEATSLPQGTSCSFNPSSVTPSLTGAMVELEIITGPKALTGSFQIQVTGDPLGPTTFPTTFRLMVIAPSSAFDYSLSSNSPVEILHGNSGIVTITATLISGTSQPVALSCVTPLPSGITCNMFTPSSVSPSLAGTSAQLIIGVSPSISAREVTFDVSGTASNASTTLTSVRVIVLALSATHDTTSTILGLDATVFYGISGAAVAILTAVASIAYRSSKRRYKAA